MNVHIVVKWDPCKFMASFIHIQGYLLGIDWSCVVTSMYLTSNLEKSLRCIAFDVKFTSKTLHCRRRQYNLAESCVQSLRNTSKCCYGASRKRKIVKIENSHFLENFVSLSTEKKFLEKIHQIPARQARRRPVFWLQKWSLQKNESTDFSNFLQSDA